MATAVIEVARRKKTLTVSSRTNVVLRGLVFRHAANCMNTTSAAVNSSNNVLIDGIQAFWNNWGGFGVFGSTNITVQNSVANYNGGLGFSATKDQNTLFTFNESDYNNWRGAQGAYYDWAMGGTKFFQMRTTTVLNHFPITTRQRACGSTRITETSSLTKPPCLETCRLDYKSRGMKDRLLSRIASLL